MDKRLRKYYYASVANLLLWLTILPSIFFSRPGGDPFSHDVILGVVVAGNILAALLQHWTYYDIYHPKIRLGSTAGNSPKALVRLRQVESGGWKRV